MKYIIKNKQLFNSIYLHLEKELEGINYSDGYDYEKDEYTNLIKWFYIPENELLIFEYISQDWFIFNATEKSRIKWLKNSPLLESRQTELTKSWDSMFSHYWHEPFKKWFQDKFPDLPVTTFLL